MLPLKGASSSDGEKRGQATPGQGASRGGTGDSHLPTTLQAKQGIRARGLQLASTNQPPDSILNATCSEKAPFLRRPI